MVVPGATFKEPTSGLEDEVFTLETSKDVFTLETLKDVARFEDTVSKLSRYVEKYRSSQSTVTQSTIAAKAIVQLVEPVFVKPERPTRKYYVPLENCQSLNTPNSQRVITKDRYSEDNWYELLENEAVIDDLEYMKEHKDSLATKAQHGPEGLK